MEKFRNIIIFVSIVLMAFAFGFSEGQASVYKKAKNDANYYHEVWGK